MTERQLTPYHSSVIAMLHELATRTDAATGKDDAAEDRLVNATAGLLHIVACADVPEAHRDTFFAQLRELEGRAHPRLQGDYAHVADRQKRVPFHAAVGIALNAYRGFLAENGVDEEAPEPETESGDEMIWIDAGVEGITELVLRTVIPAEQLAAVRDALKETDAAFSAASRSDTAALIGYACDDLERRIAKLPPPAASAEGATAEA